MTFSLFSSDGKKLENHVFRNQPKGENIFSKYIKGISKGGTFILTIETDFEKATQKIIIVP